MSNLAFWLRWSWRDLRDRWMLVSAIAATIAVGTGAYAGLSSTSIWRTNAQDASFASLDMYDLQVKFTGAETVKAGRLDTIVTQIADSALVRRSEERLVLSTQVNASTDTQTILVPGRLIGVPVDSTDPLINGTFAREGRTLTASDKGDKTAVLDYHFANHYNLPATGTVKVTGDVTLNYVGQVLTPEYFLVTTDQGGLLAEANFAAIVAPLDTVQQITGNTGQVNDLLVLLAPGANVSRVQQELDDAVASAFPGSSYDITLKADDKVYKTMYQNIGSDDKFYSIFALIMLLGATVAAFNLTSRIVESQRRQIGVAMALGLTPRWIAFRPILVGAQVALLGVVLGIGVGLLVDLGMDGLLQRYFPLPVWSAPFQTAVFARAALIGFLLPFVASLYPVWRAVSVPPINAIRTGFMSAKDSGLAPLIARLRLPGGAVAQIPVRNILRTPRRTALTALGIGAAITVMVGTTGMVDTFLHTIDVGENEVLQGNATGVEVHLLGFEPAQTVEARFRGLHVLKTAETRIGLPSTAKANGQDLDLGITLIDFEHTDWRPTITAGRMAQAEPPDQTPEILLSEAGAAQLGVGVGDVITLSHPQLNGTSVDTVETSVRVVGLQPQPLRQAAYMDMSTALVYGMRGKTNLVMTTPNDDQTIESIQKKMFDFPDVTSVQAVGATAGIFRHLVDQYLALLGIVQVTGLALALLIAFNSATIALDERSREHATMIAFGTRVRTIIAMSVLEGAVIGLLGTIIGIAGGRLVVEWITRQVLPAVVPDIGFLIYISPKTIATALVLGMVIVGAAPLLGARRLVRMDVPSALRVVE